MTLPSRSYRSLKGKRDLDSQYMLNPYGSNGSALLCWGISPMDWNHGRLWDIPRWTLDQKKLFAFCNVRQQGAPNDDKKPPRKDSLKNWRCKPMLQKQQRILSARKNIRKHLATHRHRQRIFQPALKITRLPLVSQLTRSGQAQVANCATLSSSRARLNSISSDTAEWLRLTSAWCKFESNESNIVPRCTAFIVPCVDAVQCGNCDPPFRWSKCGIAHVSFGLSTLAFWK